MRIVRWLTVFPLWLKALFLKSRMETELDEELQFHLEEQIDQLMERGLSQPEARKLALKQIGGLDRQKERCRDARAAQWFDLTRADVVFGWRQLMKRKTTTAAAVLSLGLAIGGCISVFRLVDALFFHPMPVNYPERLYGVYRFGKGFSDGKPRVETSYEYPVFQQMQAAAGNEAELIAVSFASATDVGYGSAHEIEKAEVQYVSGSMFGVFGLQAALGRLLTESDDLKPGAHPYAVLSYEYWAHRFGKDPHVIGSTVQIGETPYEIVGVGPKDFTGTEPGTTTDIFLPTMMNPGVLHPDWGWIRILAMLRPGVSATVVQEQMRAAFDTLQRERVKQFSGRPKQFLERFLSWQVKLQHAPAGISTMQDDYRLPLEILGALLAMVLLIASANVANLMSAQSAARAGEMAVRFSLGARRSRLVRMVLAESAMMGLMASAVGLIFSLWATPFVVNRIQKPGLPIRLALQPDWLVVFAGVVITLAVTLMAGLPPALRASHVQPVGALKGDAEPKIRRRWTYALIASQTAFCFVVLFAAGLLVTTFERLTQQPLGFSPDGLLLVSAYAQRAQEPALWDQTADLIRTVPGVVDVAAEQWPLLSGNTQNSFVAVSGEVNPELASTLSVSPGWFQAMHIRLLAGRDFRANDRSGQVAIINQTFAKQYFGTPDALEKRFAVQGSPGSIQVIGIAGNARYQNVREGARGLFYMPIWQADQSGGVAPISDETLVVRTAAANPLSLAEVLRKTITRAHPQLRISNIRTQQELIDAQTVRERLLAILGAFFATVALLLAGIGLYGMLSYSVLQREREFGIRIAVGAPMRNIARLVTMEVLLVVASGALIGVALALASARYLATLLFVVSATDPKAFVIPAAVLFTAAALAALRPVMRASSIDPAIMLRSE